MEKLSKKEKRRRDNLVYRLRKKGHRIDVKMREIYRLWEGIVLCPEDRAQIKKLRDEFEFNEQLIWC
jgi:hypothetical protein